jgi:hypothetical protein
MISMFIWNRLSDLFSTFDWSGHISSYNEAMIFSGPDSKSTWKMGLGTSWTKQNDTGHPTVISVTIIDLDIPEVIMKILNFPF